LVYEIITKAKPKLAVYTLIVWGRKTEENLIDLTHDTYVDPPVSGQELVQIKIGDKVEADLVNPLFWVGPH